VFLCPEEGGVGNLEKPFRVEDRHSRGEQCIARGGGGGGGPGVRETTGVRGGSSWGPKIHSSSTVTEL
jgi:hypothetical protein